MPDKIEAGDYVECLDDSNGCHFLHKGLTYKVVATHSVGYVTLEGSVTMWMTERFKKVPQFDGLHG